MMQTKRVACFFTGGYSELNAMKSFLKKANDKVHLIQLCPTGDRRSKSQIRDRHIDNIIDRHSGLTGTALTNFVLEFISKRRFLEEEYDAILIEDDKDERFLTLLSNGTATFDNDKWEKYKKDIIASIRKNGIDIPVIFILAAPEVEAWFISDWEHGFGQVFADNFTREQNAFFSVAFRRFVNQSILTDHYKASVEEYGYFDGGYKKLSEEIQKSLDNIDFLENYKPDDTHYKPRYSKRIHGETMLQLLDPSQVAQHCTLFLKNGLLQLQALTK